MFAIYWNVIVLSLLWDKWYTHISHWMQYTENNKTKATTSFAFLQTMASHRGQKHNLMGWLWKHKVPRQGLVLQLLEELI